MNNQVINSLWIGNRLSLLETLTIQSFINQGHNFRLFVYEKPETPIPFGCKVENASDIIPYEKVFRYKYKSQFGQGKGSVSGFSDIFRYKLLYEVGGWWTDMDITCLKYLNIDEPYFFRKHHQLSAVGNMMKVPSKSQLMLDCYNEASLLINENNKDWHKPIQILTDNIAKQNLSKYIKQGYTNNDLWEEVREMLISKSINVENYFCIHWMNENWRSLGLDKNDFKIRSLFSELLIKNDLIKNNFTRFHILKNEFRWKVFKTL